MGDKHAKHAKHAKHDDGDKKETAPVDGGSKSDTTHAAADAAARRMAAGGDKKAATPAAFVEKDGHLQASESDATVVGIARGSDWMVAVSGGKPVALGKGSVGSLHGSHEALVVEMRSATKDGDHWKVGDHSSGMLVSGDGASATILGEIATGSGHSWKPHGEHGDKDKLPADLAKVITENDRLNLGDRVYSWISYPTGTGKDNPAGWATTGHSKKEVTNRIADFRADAEKLPEPLKSQVLQQIEVLGTVSAVEGGYDATSGQVADTSGSLGFLQWARSRNGGAGADSIDKFFAAMAKRAQSAEEKIKKKQEPTAEEQAALDAWEQAQRMGIGVDKAGKTTITQNGKTKSAGGLDLELAAAGSSGLTDSYQVSEALRTSRNLDKQMAANLKSHHKKGQKSTPLDDKKIEVAFLDGVIGQLEAAIKDVLGSDLIAGDEKQKKALEAQATALAKKPEAEKKDDPKDPKKDAADADADAAKKDPKVVEAEQLAAIEKESKDKSARIKAADPVVRHVIDAKIRRAPNMATDEMKRYQLIAALDWLKEFQGNAVYPSYEKYREGVLPGSSMTAKTAALTHAGHTLHLASAGGSTVGDHFKTEKGLAEMAMLGVNRPAYVPTALWAALQSADPAESVNARMKTIFDVVEKLQSEPVADAKDDKAGKADHKAAHKSDKKPAAKKADLTEAGLTALLAKAPADAQSDAAQAQKALGELKGILWPGSGKEDEAQLIVKFRAEGMRIYNTIEPGDAKDNNRVGRFVTIELIDWNAVEAAKAKP